MAYKTKLSINKITFTGNISNGSPIISGISIVASLATGFEIDNLIKGAGIPAGARVLSIQSGTQITMDMNATATTTGVSLTAQTDELSVKNAEKLNDMSVSTDAVQSTIVARDSSGNIKATDFFSTDNNLYFGNLANDMKYNGIPEDEKSKWALSYNATSRVFTLTLSSTSYYYVDGKRFDLISGAHTWTAHANTAGVYFFYFSNTGTKITASAVWDIVGTAQVAYVIYNPTNDGGGPAGLLGYEVHGAVMSSVVHKYEHLINGTELISAGVVTGYTLNTGTSAAITWTLGECFFADEDIFMTSPVQPESNYLIGYLDASNNFNWRTSSLPILTNGTDIQYNQIGVGLTPITQNNKWVNYYIAITSMNTPAERIIIIPGQTVHSSLSSAQLESPTNLNTGALPFQEFVFIYQLSFRRVSGGTTSGNAELAANPSLFAFNSATLSTSANDHNLLSNRDASGAHPATAVAYDPAVVNLLSAINTQTAIDELATEKLDKLNGTATELIVNNNAIGDVSLIVNSITGTTALLQDWRINSLSKASIDNFGNLNVPSIYMSSALRNSSSSNNAMIEPSINGTIISRNIADANDALTVNLTNASSTGLILDAQAAGSTKASIEKDGSVNTTAMFKYGSSAYTVYNSVDKSIDFVFID
jgi:hypothetical protein